MNGRQRNTTNAQIWGKKNDSNYDGNCTAHHCLSGTYEISRQWIFVRLSVPITAETGKGSDNEKLRIKRKIFQKYSVTNDRKFARLTQTKKQKVQATAQEPEDTKKGQPSISRIRCSEKPNNYTETWAQRIQRPENPISMAEVEP